MGAQLHLPFSFLLPFYTLSFIPTFSPKGFGERLSSRSGSGQSRAAKRHLVHFGLKNASGDSSFSAVYENRISA